VRPPEPEPGRGRAGRWPRCTTGLAAAGAGTAGTLAAVLLLTAVAVGLHRLLPAAAPPSMARLVALAVLVGAVAAVTGQAWRSPPAPTLPTAGQGRHQMSGRGRLLAAAVAVLLIMLLVGAGVAGAAPLHLAQEAPQPPPPPAPQPTSPDLDTVLKNLRNWLIGISATVATLFFTLGGMRYLGANGDPGEVERAKQAFKNAAVGYGLAILAPLLLKALKSVVGA
ncbi:pilin, partial [Frankia sp. CiP3]|uniref:pilin n=1 Tax=Frankia sp. CiP3 TaxID=2880971 RepID=UPI0027E19398